MDKATRKKVALFVPLPPLSGREGGGYFLARYSRAAASAAMAASR